VDKCQRLRPALEGGKKGEVQAGGYTTSNEIKKDREERRNKDGRAKIKGYAK